MEKFIKDLQYYKFCAYGFLKNLRFFEPFLILYFLENDLNYLQIGTVYAVREITRNLFEVPTGVLADVMGRKKTMISAFSLYTLSFFLYYLAGEIIMIITATLVFALADAFRTGTHKAMIFDYMDIKGWTGQKVHYYGHTRSWSQMGSALSSLLAAGLVLLTGEYSTIFLCSMFPYLIGLILLASYPSWLDGETSSYHGEKLRQRIKQTLAEFWLSFRSRTVLKGIINVSSFSGYYRAVKDYVQPVISAFAIASPFFTGLPDDKRTSILVGIIYFIIYLLTSVITRRSGRFSDRFHFLGIPLNITLAAGLLFGVLGGLTFMAGWYWLTIILFVGIYLIENLRTPIGISWFSENINKDILATALSAESQGKTFFAAIIAFVTGFAAERYGIGMGILAGAILLALPLPLIFIRKKGT